MMSRKLFRGLLIVLALVLLSGCGVKTKGYMTVNAVGDDIESYGKGFKKYFDVGVVDASGFGEGEFSVTPGSRYVVLVAENAEALDASEPVESAFFIVIHDDGARVQANIVYTSGAESEGPTVSNPNWLSGYAVVEQAFTMTPEETKDAVKRAEAIASGLYDALAKIEGK